MGSWTTNAILIAIVAGVIIFIIISAITGKKNQKLERKKRKTDVKKQIKLFLQKNYNLKNTRIEYEKVASRKGKSYKYRDIFDVLVDIYESKTNKLLHTKAFEVEGVNKEISKKKYETMWKINSELDYDEVKRQIEITEGKIKLSKEEIKKRKEQIKKLDKELEAKRKEEVKNKLKDLNKKPKSQKFNPRG